MEMNLLNEKTPQEIASRIYYLTTDFDFLDYEGEKEKELQELEECIYYLKSIASNEYNKEYFRTFYNALQKI